MKKYYKDDSITLYHGDALSVLKELPAESVNCVMTSPPYWALRDYGVSGQLGLEPTFQEYIKKLCDIFDEVKRVLRKDGTCWVNLGDTYNSHAAKSKNVGGFEGKQMKNNKEYSDSKITMKKKGVPDKCLIGIPDRFKIEMIDRGWICRNEIIWYKPNCMPSSATDRFTVDFEKVFFFTKNKKYYFEQQFEELKYPKAKGMKFGGNKAKGYGNPTYSGNKYNANNMKGRNKRTVWEITTKGFSEAHFAVFPEELVETPVKAGCPKGGVVLDPFHGSGTTGLVAMKLGRKYVGIELNEEYLKMSLDTRLKQKHLGI